MRVAADEYVRLLNARADAEPARKYHRELLAFAAGDER
jgi:hypothetical protein